MVRFVLSSCRQCITRLPNIGSNSSFALAHQASASRILRNRNVRYNQLRGITDGSFFGIPHLIQTSIMGLHTLTGAPWWATIGMSTIFVRLGLFPLVRSQILASKKLSTAMPEINFLYQLLRRRLAGISVYNSSERAKVVGVFFKGVGACMRLHEVSPLELVAYPLVNLACFVTFVYSVRDMVIHGGDSYDMAEGGLLWFQDLSSKDHSFVLPLAALGSTYSALEIGFALNKGRAATFFKDAAQTLVLLSVPLVSTLPAGVFCYWLPSSAFGITQTLALRNPRLQQLLGIPIPSLPPHLQAGKPSGGDGGTTKTRDS